MSAPWLVEAPSPVQPAASIAAWRRVTVRHLWLLVPFVGVAIGAAKPIRDNSFLWHVRAGALQLQAGQVLRSDPFSFTLPGVAWRTQSWLVELGYGLLERWSGGVSWVPGLLLFVGWLTLVAVAAAVYREARRPLATALVMVGVAWLSLPFLVPRPVVISQLLLAGLMLALEGRRRWAAPLILWVWAAVHGSFVIGLGLLILEWIRGGREHRQWARTLGTSLLATSATAHGWHVWMLVSDFVQSRQALALIQEWAPPDLTALPFLPYAALIVALFVAAARRRIQPRDLWVVVPFLLFGLTARRALFPAALVLAPWAVRAWTRGPHRTPSGLLTTRRAILNWALVAGVAIATLPRLAGPWYIDPARFPIEATEALQAGSLFHDDRVGGYLIYAEGPQRQVFVDDRAELYGADFFDRYLDARRGQDEWQRIFDRYGIEQALLQTTDVLGEVLRLHGWQETYRDDQFVVLQRA